MAKKLSMLGFMSHVAKGRTLEKKWDAAVKQQDEAAKTVLNPEADSWYSKDEQFREAGYSVRQEVDERSRPVIVFRGPENQKVTRAASWRT